LDHARKQYDCVFQLQWSRRPWAPHLEEADAGIGSRAGFFWHACWYFRGGRPFDLNGFWEDIGDVQKYLTFVCTNSASSLEVSFSALEDQSAVSSMIEHCFDAALYRLGHGIDDLSHDAWIRSVGDIDSRVQVGTPWSDVNSSFKGKITLFGAGAM
jgi:hypothetical protein